MPLRSALAQSDATPAEQADFLFVQTAERNDLRQVDQQVDLAGCEPDNDIFLDRPERIAGNMKTVAFVPFWSTGSRAPKDPPNADVSILEGLQLQQVVVVLQAPALKGDTLTYTVKVLQVETPARR